MCWQSKIKAFVYDAAVLGVIVGGLAVACDLGSRPAVEPAGVAAAGGPIQIMVATQSTEMDWVIRGTQND